MRQIPKSVFLLFVLLASLISSSCIKLSDILELKIKSPSDGQVVTQPTVQIEGTYLSFLGNKYLAEKNQKEKERMAKLYLPRLTVLVNGRAAKVKANGHWYFDAYPLTAGINSLNVSMKFLSFKQEKTLNVIYQQGENQAPVAQFTVNPTSGIAPLLAIFDASTSYDSDGTVVSYHWDFGDGQSEIGATPFINHQYNIPGQYVAKLTVVDNQGAQQEGQPITITATPGYEITNLEPVDGTRFETPSIDIKGQVSSAITKLEISIGEFNYQVPIQSDRSFIVSEAALYSGMNSIVVKGYNGTQEVVRKQISVTYDPPAPGKASIQAGNAGTFSVDDTTHSLYRAVVQVPAGATRHDIIGRIDVSGELAPPLPFGFEALGEMMLLYPIGEEFDKDVTIEYPLDSSKMPAGRTLDDIKIYAFGDVWEEIPVLERHNDKIVFALKKFAYTAYVPVIEKVLNVGELQVTTNYSGATIYVDDVKYNQVTQTIIKNLQPGSHQVKLYMPPYDEVLKTVELPSDKGGKINVDLVQSSGEKPEIVWDSSLTDNMETSEVLLTASGRINYQGSLDGAFAVIVQNGRDRVIPINSDGTFSDVLALLPGPNTITVRVTPQNGPTGESGTIHVNSVKFLNQRILDQKQKSYRHSNLEKIFREGKSGLGGITIRLTWNTNATDVDLHVFDPLGRHTYYGNRQAIPGALLDRDDTDGYGPEVFTQAIPTPGEYVVNVHYFSDHGHGPSTANLTVYLGQKLLFSGSRTLSSNQTWNAFRFKVTDLNIIRVATWNGAASNNEPTRFTTGDGENTVNVTTEAPEGIADSDIKYRVTKISDGESALLNLALQGKEVSFGLYRPTPSSLTAPSEPLAYSIVAYTDSGLESAPFYLVQDTKSQIRQEYFDKRSNLGAVFSISVPRYDEITDHLIANSPYFTYEQLVWQSDYWSQGRLSVMNDSVEIANLTRESYGQELRVNSTWRNPRRNDRLANSAKNSMHQTGNAVDFNPTNNYRTNGWESERMKICIKARNILPCAKYDAFIHKDHVHIETSVDSGRTCIQDQPCRCKM